MDEHPQYAPVWLCKSSAGMEFEKNSGPENHPINFESWNYHQKKAVELQIKNSQ